MNGDRNMVKKPKKDDYIEEEEEEFELELDDDDDDDDDDLIDKRKSSSSDDARRKLYFLMAVIVGGTVLLLLFLYIGSLFSSKVKDYDDIEQIMEKAAISYFKDNPADLPQQENLIVELPVENLVATKKMKELSTYTNEGVACTGVVKVQKVGDDFVYTPILDCGDSYVTMELYNKIKNDNQIITSGYGLYNINGNYIFRGEKVNNYVQMDNSLWRVVKITTNNHVVLIKDMPIKASRPWDDRFNNDKDYSSGINNYTTSRVKEYLDAHYKGVSYDNDDEDKEVILSKKDRTKLAPFDVCYGKRSPNSEVNNNSEECKNVLNNQYLGLLTLSDYITASVDSSCKKSTNLTCQNYNYLVIDKNWWLLTSNSENTYQSYKITYDGEIEISSSASFSSIRPVIHLSDKVYYKSGKGTLEKPYILK